MLISKMPKKNVSRASITKLAKRTEDAYSAGAYRSWYACTRWLLQRLSADEAEYVLRSKWMRWCADTSSTQPPNSKSLEKYFNDPKNGPTYEKLREWLELEGV